MVEYQRFSEEYFSGCDVSIYFGDVLVDEIVALQFSMVENVAPIYGYASYTYDAVARGTRIIQGSFRIAFKEDYYIHAITNEIEYGLKSGTIKEGAPFTFKNSYGENTVDGMLKAATHLTPTEFDQLATEYEKSLWGAGNEAFTTRINEQEHTSYFYPAGRQDNLHKDGYNIMIVYGAMERENKSNGGINSTAKTIIGVQLTGCQQIIDPSGQPILEEYSFMARDLDGDFGRITKY